MNINLDCNFKDFDRPRTHVLRVCLRCAKFYSFFQSLLIIEKSTEKGRLYPKKKTKIHLNRARGMKLFLEKEPIKNRQQK